jgi:hypothetical protein
MSVPELFKAIEKRASLAEICTLLEGMPPLVNVTRHLYIETERKRFRVLKALLLAGASAIEAPLLVHLAAQSLHLPTLRLILPHASRAQVNYRTRTVDPALTLVLGPQHVTPAERAEAVHLLLAAGADPNIAGLSTPLHELAKSRLPENYELIGKLVNIFKANPNLSIRDQEGWTPMYAAAMADSPGAVEALIAVGGAVQGMCPYRRTPLHVAARNLRPAAVRALLKAGADATVTTQYDEEEEGEYAVQTPMQFLAYQINSSYTDGYRDIAAALVEAGADCAQLSEAFHEGETVPGLERALVPLMEKAPEQVPAVWARMTPQAKQEVQWVLRVAHRRGLDKNVQEIMLRAVTGAPKS